MEYFLNAFFTKKNVKKFLFNYVVTKKYRIYKISKIYELLILTFTVFIIMFPRFYSFFYYMYLLKKESVELCILINEEVNLIFLKIKVSH